MFSLREECDQKAAFIACITQDLNTLNAAYKSKTDFLHVRYDVCMITSPNRCSYSGLRSFEHIAHPSFQLSAGCSVRVLNCR